MRPIIGILAEVDNEATRVLHPYISAIEGSGGTPILLPYVKDGETIDRFVNICDGFFFTGGADIDPRHYGEEASSACGELQEHRDELEFKVFQRAIDTSKPILAICRGMQLINAALGGTLYQDLSSQHPTEVTHRCVNAKYDVEHAARLIEGTPLYDLIGKERITVNSYHHQAIKTLAVGLRASAVAEDGIIEAVYHTERRLSGFQWHPERMLDKENRLIFEDFIKECTRR